MRAGRLLLVGCLVGLVLAPAAAAHVTASPSFVRQGSESELRLAVPNERSPHVTTALTVRMPRGLEIVTADAPPGWEVASAARAVTWSGGRIEGTDAVEFTLRVSPTAEPGTVSLDAVQRYDDNRVVRWKTPLIVVPGTGGSESSSSRLIVAIGFAGGARRRNARRASAAATQGRLTSSLMLFRQFVNEDLGCASYLIGCEEAGEAVAVDPPYAVEELVDEAALREVRIVRTLETHTHADHVSGHGRLALEHEIPVSIHASAAVDYPNDPLVDGDEIRVGNVTLRCLHTPGHRPEHCCFAVIDHTRADEPWLILTGDSLFVGDTARPDLAVAGVEGATRAARLAPSPARAPGWRRGVSRSRCRLALRARHELEGLDDDRVRTTVQPHARLLGRLGVHRRARRRSRRRSRRTSIASSPSTAARTSEHSRRSPRLTTIEPSAQLLDVRGVTSFLARAPSRRSQRPGERLELCDQGGVRPRRRPSRRRSSPQPKTEAKLRDPKARERFVLRPLRGTRSSTPGRRASSR